MKNSESFEKIIEAVGKTGIGFKSFFFRSNMSYDEVFGLEDGGETIRKLPSGRDHRTGEWIVKFSDGVEYFGSLNLTEEDLDKIAENVFDNEEKSISLAGVGRIIKIPFDIDLHLKFEVLQGLDGSCGTVVVEVMPQVILSGSANWEGLKEWFSK